MEKPNLKYIQSMSNGDSAFEEKIIAIIKSELPEEKEIYHTNLKAGKYKEAAGNVHKLKHKISIFGLEESYKLAEKFEDNLLEESTELSKEFDDILRTITNYLKEI